MRGIAAVSLLLLVSGCNPGVETAKDAVRRELKDPDSAQFRDIIKCPQNDGYAGDVNAKNSYGAYDGFHSFIYVNGQVATPGSGNFKELLDLCYGKIADETKASERAKSDEPKTDGKVPEPTDAAVQEMSWRFDQKTDPINDRVSSYAFVNFGRNAITIKCDEPGNNSVYIIFLSEDYLGGDEFRSLFYRFDNDNPIEYDWYYSNNSAILGAGEDERKVSSFVKRLMSAKKIAIRAYDYDSKKINVVIDLPSDRSAIKQVYSKCGQKFPL